MQKKVKRKTQAYISNGLCGFVGEYDMIYKHVYDRFIIYDIDGTVQGS